VALVDIYFCSEKRKSGEKKLMEKEIPKYVGPRPLDRIMTKEEIRNRFDNESASLYSRQDPVYLPEYAASFELLIDCILQNRSGGIKIVDLGAGTGNLGLKVLRRNPECHLTLVDFSENMLAEVPQVLKDFPGRYNVLCADFEKVDFDSGAYDAVVSSFAIHHMRNLTAYTDLYAKIARWLKPGGVFACFDVVDGNSEEWTSLNENGWRTYLAGYFDTGKIEHIFANYHAEDTPLSIPRHFDALLKGGFGEVDVLWKRYNFAVYCARKNTGT
jgi:tRNA (cmo5U34)-methyltransferase